MSIKAAIAESRGGGRSADVDGGWMDGWTDGRLYGCTDVRKMPSVSYRKSSPLGLLPNTCTYMYIITDRIPIYEHHMFSVSICPISFIRVEGGRASKGKVVLV